MRALAHQVELPAARGADLINIPKLVRDVLPAKIALKHRVVPFRMIGDELYVAMLDAASMEARDQIAFATNKSIRVHVANEVRLQVALDRYYGAPSDERFLQLEARLDYLNEQNEHEPVRREQEEPAKVSDLVRRLTVAEAPGAIANELLAFLAPRFRRVALFQALSHGVRGWRGAGLNTNRSLSQYRQGFHQPSVFLELKAGKRCLVGRLSRVPAHRTLELALGEPPLEQCYVLPVHVGRRLAAAILCEFPKDAEPQSDATEIERLATAAGDALARCIQNAKAGSPPNDEELAKSSGAREPQSTTFRSSESRIG